MPHTSTVVRSAGVDTLTCSAPIEDDRSPLYALGRLLTEAEQKAGGKIVPFKRGPYRGFQTKRAAWGLARGRALVELRGSVAHEYWSAAAHLAEKVSRIDVEVSAWQHPYDPDMALRLWQGERGKATQRGRPSRFQLIGEATGGTTLYIGRGASRYQARMYEAAYKHPKQGLEECWRYEVQCRRERAQQMADILVGVEDIRPTVQTAVHRHFDRRGVVPIFDPSAHIDVPPLPEAETDRDKSLRWLAASVAPALERHRGWGSYEEAKAALGIRDS